MGYQKCPYEHTFFVKIGENGKLFIVCLYVDDLLFTGNSSILFNEFKKCIMNEFEMYDLGKMSYFLGIEVVQFDEQYLFLKRSMCEKFKIGLRCRIAIGPTFQLSLVWNVSKLGA